ncbi:BCCT family transporter [Peribacillus simplex]|uniref:glycine betaine uptake BCCT transporter n=1 Tax=Peribacillus simplex TaxID=1478 RepID=UPI002989A170|nr:BCCT family transporter [Peribacillus simplex]MBX9957048.1 BCCT family transporter [Peribacillus simplex]
MKKVSNVFWISVFLVVITLFLGTIAPKGFEHVTGTIEDYITSSFGWYYLIIVSLIIIFCIFLIFSPVGMLRLGKQDDRPEYSTISWFVMLFSAGMGIGLVFYGAAEPLSHFASDPPLSEPGSAQALKESMRYTFFHWGIHAWGIYALVGLSLAYFNFRKNQPGLISATLSPILGKYSRGKIGTLIDVISVFATVIGVATTLGFGSSQINGGLSYLFGIPNNFTSQVIIIIIVTVLFMVSAWSGLSKGIQILSNGNIILAFILLTLVFIVGPTMLILNLFTDTLGLYLQNIIQMSFRIAPLSPEHRTWINGWTIFYWAWWISWAPFVGLFIARVSKGRTIREFLLGVLVLPSIVSFIWFSVFGTSAIKVQQTGLIDLTKYATEEVLFAVLGQYPIGTILSIIGLLLIVIFFITSADSATFVLGMQTTYGSLEPPNSVKLTWGTMQSAIAIILLYSGGLQALQNALIIAALPFSIIMILMAVSLYMALKQEKKELGLYIRPKTSKIKDKKQFETKKNTTQ